MLDQQLAQLRAEVASLRLPPQDSPPAGELPQESTVSDPGDERRTPEALEEQARIWHERMAGVEKASRTEMRDSRWSTDTESSLRTFAQTDETLRGALRNVDCRSPICRVEIDDDQSGEFGQSLQIHIMEFGQTFSGTQTDIIDAGGGHRTPVVCMTREGASSAGH